MAQFVFRLEELLTQKVEAERKAKAAVVEKMRALEAEQAEWARLKQEEDQLRASIAQKRQERLILGENAVTELNRRNAYLEGLQQDLTAASDKVFLQGLAVEEAESALRTAQAYAKRCAQEAETLSKYREKLEQRFLAGELKKEELEQDELGTVMYLSRKASA